LKGYSEKYFRNKSCLPCVIIPLQSLPGQFAANHSVAFLIPAKVYLTGVADQKINQFYSQFKL
jgi:hypothetical protein